MSVDASALNRIPAALGHAPSVLAFFTPQSGGSPNANHIHSLYEITLYIGLAVFVLVEGALAYALLRFRARKRGSRFTEPSLWLGITSFLRLRLMGRHLRGTTRESKRDNGAKGGREYARI